jgi:hypothetical protein
MTETVLLTSTEWVVLKEGFPAARSPDAARHLGYQRGLARIPFAAFSSPSENGSA